MTAVRHLVDEDELLARLGFTRVDNKNSRRRSSGGDGEARCSSPPGNAGGPAGRTGVAVRDVDAAAPAADLDDQED